MSGLQSSIVTACPKHTDVSFPKHRFCAFENDAAAKVKARVVRIFFVRNISLVVVNLLSIVVS